ncbi:MAG: tetratricopeptide repeat protein [Pyrinomonadaceae bacterium]|nr:tetratricopeptide repeat protein [Pyrinomonadaceae bacterium]
MKKLSIITFLFLVFSVSVFAQTQQIKTITVVTEPKAIVWVNDVRRGVTDDKGKLLVRIGAVKNIVRVRANGFKEISQNLLPTQKEIKISLAKTTDQAEIFFQKAESETDKEKAADLYDQAIKLRPKYAEAYIGLARVLDGLDDTDGALEAIKNARKIRPIYPEASAIEGRIYKEDGEEAKAIASFKRAIREGKNYQPEAHTGLGLLYKEKAESAATAGDFDGEQANYNLAVNELRIALNQLYGSEPVLYEFLGVAYEKLKKYKEAIAVYEEYLKLFPNTNEATTFRSYIVQLKKQMAEQ